MQAQLQVHIAPPDPGGGGDGGGGVGGRVGASGNATAAAATAAARPHNFDRVEPRPPLSSEAMGSKQRASGGGLMQLLEAALPLFTDAVDEGDTRVIVSRRPLMVTQLNPKP